MRSLTTRSLTMRDVMTMRQRGLPVACSAAALACTGVACASPASPVRQVAGLILITAFVCAVWSIRRERFEAIVPATGLVLTFLILAGLALAAVRALSTVPVALALGVCTVAAIWIGALSPRAEQPERSSWRKQPNLLAFIGLLVFATAAVLAVRYSASSAVADADDASSVAIWAFPSGGQLQVGVAQPAGRDTASLRIVVTQNGVILATWNDVRLAPGQTWNAPPLTVTGNGPAQVVALHGQTVVASLSSQ